MSASERTGEYDKFVADAFNHFADLRAELEATRAELAAERAKPKGGVAWAIKKSNGEYETFYHTKQVCLFASKEDAQKVIDFPPQSHGFVPVPYPLGDGADELKAALEAEEKAEAEVAAWKEAANSNKIRGEPWPNPATPVCLKARLEHLAGWVSGLSNRIGTGEAEIKAAEAELAALKAAHAEVPPLDRWRVLATVAEMAYKAADFDFAKAVCLQMSVAEWKESKPYPLKD